MLLVKTDLSFAKAFKKQKHTESLPEKKNYVPFTVQPVQSITACLDRQNESLFITKNKDWCIKLIKIKNHTALIINHKNMLWH